MYINNLQKAPIKDITFEGYLFTVPLGVSICWDKFGEFLLTKIYPVKGEGGGVPPVVKATAEQWKGDRYVDVRRFPINWSLIPNRNDLIKIAKQRGVDAATIELWKEDETIDNEQIVKTINELDVPDAIKYPKAGVSDEPDTTKTAEDVLNAPAPDAPPSTGGSNEPPTLPKPPKTAKPKGARKAAAKMPTTPKQ